MSPEVEHRRGARSRRRSAARPSERTAPVDKSWLGGDWRLIFLGPVVCLSARNAVFAHVRLLETTPAGLFLGPRVFLPPEKA